MTPNFNTLQKRHLSLAMTLWIDFKVFPHSGRRVSACLLRHEIQAKGAIPS